MLPAFFTNKLINRHETIILNYFVSKDNPDYCIAIASISTLTSLGKRAT